jgi:hypothetical protein
LREGPVASVKTTVFGGVESAALDMTINPLSIIPTD